MIDQISDDIKNAMKSKDKVRLNALRFVKKLLLENKTSAKPIAELDVIISYHKKLKDSLQNFPEDHPTYTSTLDEVKVLQEYLPQPLEEAEVVSLIAEIKGSLESPQFGLVMKELSSKIKGRFDGKRASELVKESFN